MGHIEGVDRNQQVLFPEALDEYISADNPIHFVDAFVDSLDLAALGFQRAVPNDTGRPPYHPGDLLKPFVYGYLNRLRSSRLLEKEAGRNVELMWLLRKLTPDFKTIADFRKDNRQAIRNVCRVFTLYCRELGLFGGELVAIDGSKFKAVNRRDRNFTERKLKPRVKEIDAKIEEYLKELERNDEQEPEVIKPSAEDLQEKIQALKTRKARYGLLLEQMAEQEDHQISLTDPDSHSMPVGKTGKTEVGYNVQFSVDAKHKLILDYEVTNAVTDQDQLSGMASRAKNLLQVGQLEVVADMGYYDGTEVKRCLDDGITPYINKPNTSVNRKLGLFSKQDFRYDPQNDCYRCSAGEALTYRFPTNELGREIRYYSTSACSRCALKTRCTRNQESRRITRWVDEALLEEMARRIRAEPHKLEQRKCIVEHPLGTIKQTMNQGYFLMKGLSKVRTEMSLTVLVFICPRVDRVA